MSSTVQLGILLKKRHQQRMLSFVTGSYLANRQEVDYKGSTMLYSTRLYSTDVTTMIYHRSGMQGASTINLSLSTTLTLMINTLLPLGRE